MCDVHVGETAGESETMTSAVSAARARVRGPTLTEQRAAAEAKQLQAAKSGKRRKAAAVASESEPMTVTSAVQSLPNGACILGRGKKS